MLRSLWKLQWKQFAARMKKGNGKKTSGGWLAFLMLFFVVCMEILMFVVFAELVPLCEMGLTWLYFAMAGTVALALSMLGSVFMTQAQLYDAKDNELLLSMPIPPKYILLTRIAMLFTTTAGYTLAVLLPAFGIYAFSYGASATMIIGWLFTFVALSLISQSVCCALGWVLHKLLSRLRNLFGRHGTKYLTALTGLNRHFNLTFSNLFSQFFCCFQILLCHFICISLLKLQIIHILAISFNAFLRFQKKIPRISIIYIYYISLFAKRLYIL